MCEGRIMQCLEVTAARSIICWLQYCSCDTAWTPRVARMMLTRLSSFQLENSAIKLLIRCYHASMTQQRISLMDKSLILRLNCNCSGTPNCNLLVEESPPAVGKTPMGKTPVGKTPMGKTPVGKTLRSPRTD